ncbi:hypothetical protein CEXT_209111 [Caerostris extrusa]|uniref:Uncharacterized protein n=1 Tax=Caerostris extrusa TaxID=172846 RepID=A0AAV4MFW2_CAEEX|nr:hypothetical protein CEXT_209111 [Caerostris extrusa]
MLKEKHFGPALIFWTSRLAKTIRWLPTGLLKGLVLFDSVMGMERISMGPLILDYLIGSSEVGLIPSNKLIFPSRWGFSQEGAAPLPVGQREDLWVRGEHLRINENRSPPTFLSLLIASEGLQDNHWECLLEGLGLWLSYFISNVRLEP